MSAIAEIELITHSLLRNNKFYGALRELMTIDAQYVGGWHILEMSNCGQVILRSITNRW